MKKTKKLGKNGSGAPVALFKRVSWNSSDKFKVVYISNSVKQQFKNLLADTGNNTGDSIG